MSNDTGTAYDRLLDALRDNGSAVNANHQHARARCPNHEGNSDDSLAITDTPDQALIHCFGGCDTKDVLAALNLTLTDLYNDPKGTTTYLYSGGRKVHRTPTKTGKKITQSGTMSDRSLFQVEDIGDAGTVYVTEGEKDALNLAHVHKVAAVSPAQGAGTDPDKWDWTPLSDRHVKVIQDKDDKGRKHAEAVAAHLKSIAKSVEILEPAAGKDVSDHIAAGKTLDELVTPSLLDGLGVTSEWLETQEFPDLEEIVPGLIVEGVTVLAGPPKVGKSFLVGNVTIAVVSGGKALGRIDVRARPALVFALEDGHRRLQKRYREIAEGPIPPGITFITKATPAECVSVIEEFFQRHRDEKPIVILDTLGKVKPQKRSGQESYLVDYEVGGKFKTIAESCPGSAIVIIHHTRKADSGDFVDLVSGTQGIAGSVDAIITLARKRGEADAVLSITGRDVMENEYALTVKDGSRWQLDGDSLAAASQRMDVRREDAAREKRAARLSPDMRKVLELINGRGHVTSEEITFKLKFTPNRVSVITTRLVEGDFIVRTGRGEYHSLAYEAANPARGEVSEVFDVIEASDTSDTSLTTDTSLPSLVHKNTCECGAPLMQPKSLDTGLCAECRLRAAD